MNPASSSSSTSTCSMLMNLPSEIIIKILARLPVRIIIGCKCVCKQLLSLLAAPEFVAYHLSLSTPGLAIRQLVLRDSEDTCQIFEFEDEFDLQTHNLHDNVVMKFDPTLSIGFPDVTLRINGSVNGILCLCGDRSKPYADLYLCNPITREYIALPRIEGVRSHPDVSEFGFGVSRISGQYKVVGNVHMHSSHSTVDYYECLVYTVGTGSWRNVQPGKPFGHSFTSFSLLLNGNLHGLQDCGDSADMLISCFDLETESFTPFPPPPPAQDSPPFGTLGILDDCLCFVDSSSQDSNTLVIWVMREYGVKESWTKQLVITGSQGFVGKFCNIYPIKSFKDGDIMFNDDNENLFYFCNKTETCIELDLVTPDRDGWTEAIPHSSSFLELKSFDGENVISF